ncbi:TetR/AcrR family transcriptional regulator [Pseudomonas sp. N040]|uniref:TetR/AcrR family transcriptional regulator n=1 Tax=Pseudomonas sp. N040 TaxID=2785325 RepID=UPI0018A26A6D|nr:TetR/AcrR family transcriptional regulator [Pseudomonas sp. N040]MBF7731568.1 TetR/AcrR family transcriptional regulator [Pseudomonas sp. N040]MBW7015212.1 TetR/AcrR family transcriptional regulator [Pseudomonas sp. N040]
MPSDVASSSLPSFENQFLHRARYAKGRQTLQAILDATYDLIIAEGPTAASQKAIAERARVTQSAVRHYFPTKEELLAAFFTTGIERLQSLLKAKIAEVGSCPRTQLLESAELQFGRIREVDDVFFFESVAFWRRHPRYGALRDNWYQELHRYYQRLLQRMHPEWAETSSAMVAYQVLTLILGGWTMAGRSRPLHGQRPQQELTAMLLNGVERLIDAPLAARIR